MVGQAGDLVALVVLRDAGPVIPMVDRRHGVGDAGQPAGDVPGAMQEGQGQGQHAEGQQGAHAAG